MPQPWLLPGLPEGSGESLVSLALHPLITRLLLQRGFDTSDKALPFLNPAHYTPSPPTALVGLERAAHLLFAAIHEAQNILVWGDFDVDGQTSTSLLVAALRELCGEDQRVRFHVPNRFKESHGIRPAFLRPWLTDSDWPPHLLLTCDTGIGEQEAVQMAKAAGLTVIITDHHDLPEEFADYTSGSDPCLFQASGVRGADAIVNPKLQPPADPLRTIPGVGVVYKLIQQLFILAGRPGEAAHYLDLVALGIVADVAEQVHDTRYLLQLGLDELRKTRRMGLKALMEVARVNPEKVDAEAIGFQLGPRMNALGRLEDATVAVELLTTRDALRAGHLAAQMNRLNDQRRLLTSQISASALDLIARNPGYLDFNALVLAHPAWHAGIVGIVASRLVEEFGKPTVLLLNPPDGPARGSARSVAGVDIGGAIAACSHLLLTHGGHPGAAGVSLESDNIDRFRRELDRQIPLHRTESGPPGLTIDAELSLAELDFPLAEALQQLAPFGNGNPEPLLMSRNVTVVGDRRLGREGTHRRLTIRGQGEESVPVIWFRGADGDLPSGPLDLAYYLKINEFRGQRTLQLIYVDSRSAQPDAVTVDAPSTTTVTDYRGHLGELTDLPLPTQSAWYAEGTNLGQIPFAPRGQVRRRGDGGLVLWSIPPSAGILTWLVKSAAPTQIYLCARATPDDRLDVLLRQVAGMCKYALSQDGELDLALMAARLGMTEGVIRYSLLWLEAKGLVNLMGWDEGDTLRVAPGSNQDQSQQRGQLQAALQEQLAEVRAYRHFFVRATPQELGLTG